MASNTVREQIMQRIRSNLRHQNEIVESKLGQFSETDRMRWLGRELAQLENELNVMDSHLTNNNATVDEDRMKRHALADPSQFSRLARPELFR